MLIGAAKQTLRLRSALGGSRRLLATAELPLEPPIAMFGIAGRYASALYAAAAKKGTLQEVEDDLKLFKETVSASPVLANFVADPSVSRDAKVAGITSLMESAKASETTKNALATMAEGGRLGDVFKVMDLYVEQMSAAKGEVRAIITSAKPMQAAELEQVKASLSKFTDGKKMIVTVQVKPALINGITVELGDKYLDLSVATQLTKLQALLGDSLPKKGQGVKEAMADKKGLSLSLHDPAMVKFRKGMSDDLKLLYSA